MEFVFSILKVFAKTDNNLYAKNIHKAIETICSQAHGAAESTICRLVIME